MCNRSPASVRGAYALWLFFGLFGAHVRARCALRWRAACNAARGGDARCFSHSRPCFLPTRPRPAQRFYVGRPVSGLVWLFTVGLFGVGWVIDAFLIPEFVEEHNKKARFVVFGFLASGRFCWRDKRFFRWALVTRALFPPRCPPLLPAGVPPADAGNRHDAVV